MTESQTPPSTSTHVERPAEVVLENAPLEQFQESWPGYVVQAHDINGRPLFDAQGRPVLVPQGSQSARHPLGQPLTWVLFTLVLILVAMCIIGGIGLHYLDQLRGG